MEKRPKILTFFSSFTGALSLLFPLQSFLLFQSGTVSMSTMVLINYFLVLLFIFSALAMHKASSTMIALLPAMTVSGLAYNFFLYHLEWQSFGFFVATSAIFFSFQLVWLSEDVRFICKNPQFRWWRVPKRSKIKTSVYVSPMRGDAFSGHTFDISTDGAFIPYELGQSRVFPGEEVQLRLTLGSLRTVRFTARIVRVQSEILGQYPPGFALRFEGANREHRRYLESFISLQKQAA